MMLQTRKCRLSTIVFFQLFLVIVLIVANYPDIKKIFFLFVKFLKKRLNIGVFKKR